MKTASIEPLLHIHGSRSLTLVSISCQYVVDAEINESSSDPAAGAILHGARCGLVGCRVGTALGIAEGNALPAAITI
jgi:hypothetical protein